MLQIIEIIIIISIIMYQYYYVFHSRNIDIRN